MAECLWHSARHTTRLARLGGWWSVRPVGSLPTACHGWAETGASERFLDYPAMGVQALLSSYTHATLERLHA